VNDSGKNDKMTSSTRFRFTFAALAGLLSLPNAALAADPVPLPPPSIAASPTPSWRSYAFPAALVGTGASVASAITFKLLMDKRNDDFNSFGAPSCTVHAPGRGGSECAKLYDKAESAERWLKISAASAGAFAVAALVFKLTEPESGESAPRLACAPGLGAHASCRLTF
jgi:hypothetical protein